MAQREAVELLLLVGNYQNIMSDKNTESYLFEVTQGVIRAETVCLKNP